MASEVSSTSCGSNYSIMSAYKCEDFIGNTKPIVSLIALVTKDSFESFAKNPYAGQAFYLSCDVAEKMSKPAFKRNMTFLSCSLTFQEPLLNLYQLLQSSDVARLASEKSPHEEASAELHLIADEKKSVFQVEIIKSGEVSTHDPRIDQVIAVTFDELAAAGCGDLLKLHRLDPFSRLASSASKVNSFIRRLQDAGFFASGESAPSLEKIRFFEKVVTRALSQIPLGFEETMKKFGIPYRSLYAKRWKPAPSISGVESCDVVYILRETEEGDQLDFILVDPCEIEWGGLKVLRRGASFLEEGVFALLRFDRRIHKDMTEDRWLRKIKAEIQRIEYVDRMNSGKMPYIVRYYGFYCINGDYTLVTDYYSLRSAYDFFLAASECSTRPPSLTDEDRLRELAIGVIIEQIQALAWLHAQGIAHRDVKPDNILLTEEDGMLVSALADFGGIASLTARHKTPDDIRTTYEFLAPEFYWNLTDETNTLTALDSWSVGITALCLITRKFPPWRRRGSYKERYATINEFFSDKTRLQSALDAWIPEGAIGDCIRPFLELDPLKRATPAAMIEAWEKLL